MSTTVKIVPPHFSIKGEVSLPVSKSISNRILMLKAYSGDLSHEVTEKDVGDTLLLKKLLLEIAQAPREERVVLNCLNAGTVLRFLLAFVAQREGEWILTGSERMCERPIEPLVKALRVLGAEIFYEGREGFPPLRVVGKPLSSQVVEVDTSISSQFVSSLLLLSTVIPGGLSLKLTGEKVSTSYMRMTMKLLQKASMRVVEDDGVIRVSPGKLRTEALTPEADWSSAAFWFALVALSQRGKILIKGVGEPEDSLQGDAVVADIFRSIGVAFHVTPEGVLIQKPYQVPALSRVRLNMKSTPDLTLPVVTALSGLGYGALISGIHHLQFKESDRIKALVTELRALNVAIDYVDRMLVVHPSSVRAFRPVNTYDDHRMAMAFAPLSLVLGTLDVRDPQVVEKSYPHFWEMLKGLGFGLRMS
ncbi:MAG: 3-phosphoshikimate 1-carboxyvinyltransferase [Bacteroidetes bacterium]|nr:MAG: 3-phosphoshikimate 1-carboxyvinyltransferase [Bacteroidota bacterium]PIE87713.1 MAG: 3-phosphoshikimate 1-carboxyvinyltransferase [Bacteroidota bacterium]